MTALIAGAVAGSWPAVAGLLVLCVAAVAFAAVVAWCLVNI